jgi:hypothetical protein
MKLSKILFRIGLKAIKVGYKICIKNMDNDVIHKGDFMYLPIMDVNELLQTDLVLVEKGSEQYNKIKKEHEEKPKVALPETEFTTYPPQKRGGCEAQNGCFRRVDCNHDEENPE